MTSELMPVYGQRLPIAFTHGQGIWLWNNESTQEPYLDALSGKGVSNLGYNHPEFIQALQKQIQKLLHTSNLYRIEQQEMLAYKLCCQFQMAQAFFTNSGAETVESAIKIARVFGKQKAIQQPIIISLKGSYHGRTPGALILSGSQQLLKEKERSGLDQTQENIQIPINDIATLRKTVEQYHRRIIGIIFEPIQGDGGMHTCSKLFVQTMRQLCDQHNFLMIADEIQTGLCRTGTWIACNHFQITPDVLLLAKALGNGIPIGAYLVNEKIKDCLKNSHGSTFAGNPLACVAALTVIEQLKTKHIDKIVQQNGIVLKQKLQEALSNYSIVQAIRGRGFMLGIQLTHPPSIRILQCGLSQKVLFDIVAQDTIRLLPPLILTLQEINELVRRLKNTLDDYSV